MARFRSLEAVTLACLTLIVGAVVSAHAQNYPSPHLKSFQVDQLPTFTACTGLMRGRGSTAITCGQLTASDISAGTIATVLGYVPAQPIADLSCSTACATVLASAPASANVIASLSAGPQTITLPACIGTPGISYTFKKTDATSNALTLATTSGQTIDGATSIAFNIQWTSRSLRCISGAWYVL